MVSPRKDKGFGGSALRVTRRPSGLRKQTSSEIRKDSPSKHKDDGGEVVHMSSQKSEQTAAENQNYQNVMSNDFRLRKAPGMERHGLSKLQAIIRDCLGKVFPDIYFALGHSILGGWRGTPATLHGLHGNEKAPFCSQQCIENASDGDKDNHSRARRLLNKMKGSCDMSAIRFLAWFLSKLWRACFRKIFVNLANLAKVREMFKKAAKDDHAVLVLPTHRSHMDYLLLSYVFYGYDLPVPHIASGDNLNIPIIGPIFSAAGAFFMKRRMKGDELYKRVLYHYILSSLKDGKPVEFFVEGGRTRTGQISDPKLGLVSMIVKMVNEKRIPDIKVLPISIDYDQTLESESYANHLLGQAKKSESLKGVIKGGAELLSKSLHGEVYVNFAEPISVKGILQSVDEELKLKNKVAQPADYALALGERVVQLQRSSSTIGYTALVATVLLSLSEAEIFREGIELEVKGRIEWLAEILERNKTPVETCGKDFESSERLREAMTVLLPVFKPLRNYSRKTQSKKVEPNTKQLVLILAKARLRLRYSSGQLPVVLTAFAVVATALQVTLYEESRVKASTIHFQTILSKAKEIAKIVKFHVPGCDVSPKTLRKSLVQLAESLGIRDGERVCQGHKCFEEKLRILFSIISPFMSTVYNMLLSLGGLVEDAAMIHANEKKLVSLCQDTVYDQFNSALNDAAKSCRGDARSEMTGESDTTDVISVADSDHSDEVFGIGLTDIATLEDFQELDDKEWQEVVGCFGTPHPDALSSKNISAAIKYLKSVKVLEKADEITAQSVGILNRSLDSVNSVGSVVRSLGEMTSRPSLADLKEKDTKKNDVHYRVAVHQREDNGRLIWNKLQLLQSYTSVFKDIGISPGQLHAVARNVKSSTSQGYSMMNVFVLRRFSGSYAIFIAYFLSRVLRWSKGKQKNIPIQL